jgi:hypothetical protein
MADEAEFVPRERFMSHQNADLNETLSSPSRQRPAE